ncbi:MAG: nucleotidyltransferase family protein [Actinomycetia bacterium]|nr:nucleotidyltransferase family protein [Actinomycetes bacterium]
MLNPSKIDVVILCGGFGKRLQRVVKEIPKPMARIKQSPFLDILIDFIASYGFKRFILCTGYKAEIIERYYNQRYNNLIIEFSREEKPLGTGGAIKNAENYIKSSPFLVANGDSLCKINLKKFIDFHFKKDALTSIAVTNTDVCDDYGVVTINNLQQIVMFNEKIKGCKNRLINAGFYLLQKEVFSLMPENDNFSIESDFFPKIIKRNLYAFKTQESVVDIGTPERYEKAKHILR